MFTSLFSPEVKDIFDNAEKLASLAGGPYPSPPDWRDQVVYFIMVDRFNNPTAEPVHKPYDDQTYGLYQGGNFAGIKQQLSYIKSLGASAVWLSPVLKNLPWDGGSYHGYGIHDFLRAEPKFATDPANADEELRALVDAAHEAGLYVIFDIVFNHTGNVFDYNGNPQPPFSATSMTVQWKDSSGTSSQFTDVATIPSPSVDSVVWPSELQKNEYFRRQGEPDPKGDFTLGDFQTLRQMMTGNPDVQHFLIRAYQYVIARFDIDGFRIDTVPFLKNNLAQLSGNAIREYALILGKKNFFTFGEVLDSNIEPDIAQFIGRNTTFGGDMNSPVGIDAALDYPLFFSFVNVVKGFSAPSSVVAMYNFRKKTEQYILSSHGDASRYFVTFLDNHDVKKRFRWVEPGNENLYDDQVTMGFACLYCLPGIPCVYYGTEQGLHGYSITGKDDPAVREALWGIAPSFSKTGAFFIELQKIASVRNAEPALRYGRFYFRPISGDSFHFAVSNFPSGVLAWSRILNDEEVVIVANTNTSQTLSVDVILEMTLCRPGQNIAILYSNKTNPTSPGQVKVLLSVEVTELDGSTDHGPLYATRVTLQHMEVQILRAKINAG